MDTTGNTTYKVSANKDYDKEVKFNGKSYRCYSKSKLDSKYGDKSQYTVLGEISKNKVKSPLGQVAIGSGDSALEVDVAMRKTHNRLFYKEAGYLCIGDDIYLSVIQYRWLFILLFPILLVGIITGTIALVRMFSSANPVISPVNPLPDVDPYIEPIGDVTESTPETTAADETEPGETTSELDPNDPNYYKTNGRSSVNMIYKLQASLDLNSKLIEIYFKNPSSSNRDVVIEMYLVSGENEVKIAESGRVSSGNALYKLSFTNSDISLSSGKLYEGKFKVIYYDPTTGERALVESEITDLSVSVN